MFKEIKTIIWAVGLLTASLLVPISEASAMDGFIYTDPVILEELEAAKNAAEEEAWQVEHGGPLHVCIYEAGTQQIAAAEELPPPDDSNPPNRSTNRSAARSKAGFIVLKKNKTSWICRAFNKLLCCTTKLKRPKFLK